MPEMVEKTHLLKEGLIEIFFVLILLSEMKSKMFLLLLLLFKDVDLTSQKVTKSGEQDFDDENEVNFFLLLKISNKIKQ